MRRILSLMAGLALLTPAARAEDCAAAADQATMNHCADRDFHDADARLNRTYAQVLARLEGDRGRKELLMRSERAWLAYRDARCAFESAGVEGGSVQPMIHATCLADATRQRVGTLQEYLNCVEGDLSCPVPPAGAR